MAQRIVLRGDHNECPTCGKLFNSTFAFDAHRTGAWPSLKNGITKHERRCMTTNEMEGKGMGVSRRGWWVTKVGYYDIPTENT